MNSSFTNDIPDAFKRESTSVTIDAPSTTVPSWIKPSSLRKHRILSHRPSIGKGSAHEFQTSRTMTAANRPSSKLPNLVSNTQHQSVTAGKRFSVSSLLTVKFRFNATSARYTLVKDPFTAVTAENRSATHFDEWINTVAHTLLVVQCRRSETIIDCETTTGLFPLMIYF